MASFVAAFVLGLLLGIALMSSPPCPTEDSCSIDYRNGAWHIERTQP